MVIVKFFAAGENRADRIRKALYSFLLPGKTPPSKKMPESYPREEPGIPPTEKTGFEKSPGPGNRD